MKKKHRVMEKSKSVIDLLRSQVVASGGETTPTPSVTERKATGMAICPPSKHQRGTSFPFDVLLQKVDMIQSVCRCSPIYVEATRASC